MTTKIGFIGLGKLGLDCAEVFAEQYAVCGYDIAARHSNTVNVLPLSDTIAGSDWIFIAVPTPHHAGYDGSTPSCNLPPKDFDYTAVKQAIEAINSYANTPKQVVLISTVLPGTVRQQLFPLLDRKHRFVYNPYLIAMGSVKWDMVHPEMVIIGTNDGDTTDIAQQLVDLYRPLILQETRYEIGTWEEAESIKIFYNTFISAKVSLVNMIQDFAMRIGHVNVDRVTGALAQSTTRIMGPKYMTAGMGDAGACHPRDNIALRWLAQEYDIGYDIFATIMLAREQQAQNLAQFLFDQATKTDSFMPIVIHGKTYKPDVPYCHGSYSLLVGHFLKNLGVKVRYLDPLAEDRTDVINSLSEPAVILLAHNRSVTYGYTGRDLADRFYAMIPAGSILVDPWRQITNMNHHRVVQYGNSR